MNGRERVFNTLAHNESDHIAIYESFWQDTLIRWRQEGLGADTEPADLFDFDIYIMGIDASPRFTPELLEDDGEMITLRDRFGYVVRKHKNKSRTMGFLSHPVKSREDWSLIRDRLILQADEPARTDLQAFPFRLDMGPSWDRSRQGYNAVRKKEKYILGSAYGPHEAILRLRGFEQTLYDLVDEPELLQEMAEGYTDFLLEVLAKCLSEEVRFDGFFMVEDLASTRGMLFSPNIWRSIFKPSVEKIGGFLKDNGLNFWMHCCGNAEPVFRDLIDCGLDVINPLEAKSGLDVRVLKAKYGGELTFFGNIDVMAMSGSDEEIEKEISEKVSVAKVGGGYIYHSDHSVPPEVPFERFKFIMDLVKKYGAYQNVITRSIYEEENVTSSD